MNGNKVTKEKDGPGHKGYLTIVEVDHGLY